MNGWFWNTSRLFKNTPSFTEDLQWLILTFLGFQPVTLWKKRLRHRCFSVNFAKLLRASSDRTPRDDCFLCLSVNFEKFFRSPKSTFGKLLISSTSCWISTTRYRTVLHPDVFWYRLNAQKNVFPYMFHVKPKSNIVYKYSKKNFYSRDSNILPQMHWT